MTIYYYYGGFIKKISRFVKNSEYAYFSASQTKNLYFLAFLVVFHYRRKKPCEWAIVSSEMLEGKQAMSE